MKNNPLNDLVHKEGTLAPAKRYASQEETSETGLEDKEEGVRESNEFEDMNDNIFLFLD
jgi:hypothetical protein